MKESDKAEVAERMVRGHLPLGRYVFAIAEGVMRTTRRGTSGRW